VTVLTFVLFAALQTAPAIGPIRSFGDWAVACDNLLHCEATSLIGEETDWPDDGPLTASIAREAGPAGGFTVTIDAGEKQGIVTVKVDGTVIARTTVAQSLATFAGADAGKIVAAGANGTKLVLEDSTGTAIATISLVGSSAALRFIDDRQGRVGTVSAAIAKGIRPAGSVPATPAAPRIAALKGSGKAAPVTAALRAQMEKAVDCSDADDGGKAPEIETAPLDGGATLALLPCGNGAYNYNSIPFVIRGGQAAVAQLDYGDSNDGRGFLLTNAGWDADQSRLVSYAKGRGLGDCGDSAQYVWDGRRFRVVEVRSMNECRGSVNWLRLWYAEPLLR
jgi:hypothetical protein